MATRPDPILVVLEEVAVVRAREVELHVLQRPQGGGASRHGLGGKIRMEIRRKCGVGDKISNITRWWHSRNGMAYKK